LVRYLNPNYSSDRLAGRALKLPDLLSVFQDQNRQVFRLREVKYKLEERLILKALRQLESGSRQMNLIFNQPRIDRLEIAVPLRDRRLKKEEIKFLGSALTANRFELELELDLQGLNHSFKNHLGLPSITIVLL
jgi:hypothetical protein